MANDSTKQPKIGFHEFYRNHFLAEHQHPATVALHILGTVVGTVFLVMTLLSTLPYLALLYPLVHALPGLIGHRLFERNASVGDVRVLRKDFSPLWFIAGNHVLTYEAARTVIRKILFTHH
jgi:hypothetical protein